jgi:prepilin-type N-terminal cleavage/methylation domain-containing protein
MHRRSAFTLIELLVVIAILAVLAVVVVLTLNPAGLLQESRDANRLSDMATLNSAISDFSADVQTTNALGAANTLYISVPDPTATSSFGDQCQGLNMPALPSGWTYQCAGSNWYRLTNGTGWIPINFSQASFGAPLSELPIDPINTTSTGLYYTYVTNGTQFEVTSIFESQKDKLQYANSPLDPYYPEVDAKGSNLTLSPIWNPSGLVGYWPLNEGTGTIAYDQSGDASNGSWAGTQAGTSGYYSGGKVGSWAGYFNGSNDYVNIPDNAVLHVTAFTVSAWFKEASSATGAIVTKWTQPGNQRSFALDALNTNKMEIVIDEYGNGATSTTLNDPNSFSLSSWNYAVATFDGATARVYLNGQLDASASSVPPFLSTSAVTIGEDGGGNSPLPGQVDDVRIYNRALSAAEIQELYDAER